MKKENNKGKIWWQINRDQTTTGKWRNLSSEEQQDIPPYLDRRQSTAVNESKVTVCDVLFKLDDPVIPCDLILDETMS